MSGGASGAADGGGPSPRRHLVVVVPGIGGTKLAVPKKGERARGGLPVGDRDRVVWRAGLRDASLLVDPGRLSLSRYEHLVPVGLIGTLTPFGAWTPVHGYDGLLKSLASIPGVVVDDGTPAGRNLDANVVAFGYDFRRSITEASEALDREVRIRLAHLWPGDRNQVGDGPRPARVIVVAHSMGGLVARGWIAHWGGAEVCRGLITLGTPHRGAPKALEVLVNGIPVAGGALHLTRLRGVMRDWPSMAELLPRYRAIADVTARRGTEERAAALYPHELPISWLAPRAKDAFRVHEQIREGWKALDAPPDVQPRIGDGHATLRSCTWDGRELRVTPGPPAGPDLGDWARDEGRGTGDGTVPTFCGIPLEMDKKAMRGLAVPERHGPIAALAEVGAIIEAWESDRSLTPIRAGADGVADGRPGLGLSIDEVQVAGHRAPVAARPAVTDGASGSDGAGTQSEREFRVELTVYAGAPGGFLVPAEPPGGAGPDVGLEWDPAARSFAGELPALAPGTYVARVTGRGPGVELVTEQAFEVVGDECD